MQHAEAFVFANLILLHFHDTASNCEMMHAKFYDKIFLKIPSKYFIIGFKSLLFVTRKMLPHVAYFVMFSLSII